MTHDELVKRAGRWLRNDLNCGVVLCEMKSLLDEIPDAIGWVNNRSILVECKTSAADFYADLSKPFRHQDSRMALGRWRFYFSQEGIIPHDKLPDRWGLYEVHGRSVRHAAGIKYRNMADIPFESNEIGERLMLISALRRTQQ